MDSKIAIVSPVWNAFIRPHCIDHCIWLLHLSVTYMRWLLAVEEGKIHVEDPQQTKGLDFWLLGARPFWLSQLLIHRGGR